MNIPNCLSIVRILLIPVFVVAYFFVPQEGLGIWPVVILLASGLTDMLDGIIARKYNMITNLGKILDPLADKLTQLVVCICLAIRHNELIFLLLLFIIKEVIMLLGALKLIHSGKKVAASRWYGKLATLVFYFVMMLIILLPGMQEAVRIILLVIAAAFMIFAFAMYVPIFLKIQRGEDID